MIFDLALQLLALMATIVAHLAAASQTPSAEPLDPTIGYPPTPKPRVQWPKVALWIAGLVFLAGTAKTVVSATQEARAAREREEGRKTLLRRAGNAVAPLLRRLERLHASLWATKVSTGEVYRRPTSARSMLGELQEDGWLEAATNPSLFNPFGRDESEPYSADLAIGHKEAVAELNSVAPLLSPHADASTLDALMHLMSSTFPVRVEASRLRMALAIELLDERIENLAAQLDNRKLPSGGRIPAPPIVFRTEIDIARSQRSSWSEVAPSVWGLDEDDRQGGRRLVSAEKARAEILAYIRAVSRVVEACGVDLPDA